MVEMLEAPAVPEPRRSTKTLVLLLLTLSALGLGFSVAYFGLIIPATYFSKVGEAQGRDYELSFVDIPSVVLSLPGSSSRILKLTSKVEVELAQVESVRYLIPRISDSFIAFLSEVDPLAFERKGVLDVIRNELRTRTKYILGEGGFREILITEFIIK